MKILSYILFCYFLYNSPSYAVERNEEFGNDELKAFYHQNKTVEEQKVNDDVLLKKKIEPYIEGAVLEELNKVNQRLRKFWEVSRYTDILNVGLDITKIKEHDKIFYNNLINYSKNIKEKDLEFIDFYIKHNDIFEEKSLFFHSFTEKTILNMNFRGISKKILDPVYTANYDPHSFVRGGLRQQQIPHLSTTFQREPYAQAILEKDLENDTIFDIAKKERHKLFFEDYKHALEYYNFK